MSMITTYSPRGALLEGSRSLPLLILFTESLGVRFAVRIEDFLTALLPRCFELRRGDIPVRPTFPSNGTQVLAQIFQRGATQEPVAVVDFINDKTGLQDDYVGDHGIVERIGVLGNVEIFLDGPPHVGEERPVGADQLRYSFVSVILSVLIVTSRQ